MNTISFNCPHCSQPFKTDASRAGARGRCPKCAGTIVVPDLQPIEPILAVEAAPEPPAPETLGSCPFCRGDMLGEDNIQSCPSCETPHHKECWDENKGCTVFGCSMAPPEEETVSVDAAAAAVGQLPSPAVMESGASEVYERAGLGKRFCNFLVDYFAILVCIFVVWFAIGFTSALFGFSVDALLQFQFFVNLAVYIAFYVIFESTFGRTPAKFLTGTVVRTEDGQEPTTEQIVKRSLSRIVPFEAFSFFGKEPTGWHDRWSGTGAFLVKPYAATSAVAASTATTTPATEGAYVVLLEDGSQSEWIGEQMVRQWLRMGKISEASMIYSAEAQDWASLSSVLNLNPYGSPA